MRRSANCANGCGGRADVPESLREVRTLFGGLDALAGERSPERWKPRRIRRMAPLWGIAAAAAVVLGIFVCADLLRKPYCYIDGVAVYDAEVAMQTTVYLESFSCFGGVGADGGRIDREQLKTICHEQIAYSFGCFHVAGAVRLGAAGGFPPADRGCRYGAGHHAPRRRRERYGSRSGGLRNHARAGAAPRFVAEIPLAIRGSRGCCLTGSKMGFNLLTGVDYAGYPAETADFLDLRAGNSFHFGVTPIGLAVRLDRRGKFEFATGLRYTVNNYRLSDNTITLGREDGLIVPRDAG